MEALFYPYLPTSDRSEVGPWQLIPFGDLANDDLLNEVVKETVEGLVGLYSVDDPMVNLGAIARAREGKVGDDIDRQGMQNLGRALLVSMLDANTPALDQEEPANAGHGMTTSDNAIGYGHPIDGSGGVAVEYGVLVRRLEGGMGIKNPDYKIQAPIELPRPMLGRGFDDYYASALYELLDVESDAARRLGRAIDWLGLAWRNTTSLNFDLRVIALRTGFEVLFDESDTQELRASLSALLDGDDPVKKPRKWTNRSGKVFAVDLTDLEWWFTCFTELRAAIAHGDPIPDERYRFEGQWHFWIAESRLREAIKELVARAGHPDVKLEYGTRILKRAYEEAAAKAEATEEE